MKPFMYVEKVVPKRKTEQTAMKHTDVWMPNPAIDTTRKPKHLKDHSQSVQADGQHVSMYDIEEHKRSVAKEFFERVHQCDPEVSLRRHFAIWSKGKRLKLDADQNSTSLTIQLRRTLWVASYGNSHQRLSRLT